MSFTWFWPQLLPSPGGTGTGPNCPLKVNCVLLHTTLPAAETSVPVSAPFGPKTPSLGSLGCTAANTLAQLPPMADSCSVAKAYGVLSLLLLRPPLLAAAVMRPGMLAVSFPAEAEATGTQKLQSTKNEQHAW